MSDNETVEDVVDQEIPTSMQQDFIDMVQAGNFNKAKEQFDTMMADKMTARLDAEKAAVASSIFNSDEDIDLEDDDFFDVEDGDELDELDQYELELEDEDTAEQEGKEIYSGAEI
jgi:hypothetical protein